MPRIDTFLQLLSDESSSDLHLQSGTPPVVRYNGDLQRIAFRALTPEEVRGMLYELLEDVQISRFELGEEVDFAYEVPGLCRFRINAYLHKSGPAMACRAIPRRIPTIEDLQLPPILSSVAAYERGLVLVTGPTGSGKSTTLAAIIDQINRSSAKHIITIEDPIEYVHESKRAYISQREVGSHTDGFSQALRSALRESADVVLVGELRDLETISLALDMTETGTLVFSTLHTAGAARTIDRVIDVFPADQRPAVAAMLAGSLRAVISQQLVRTADGTSRTAAVEVLLYTYALSNLIREGKTHQIGTLIQAGSGAGMQTMDAALGTLVRRGRVAIEEGEAYAHDRDEFRRYAERAGDNGAAL